MANKKYLGYLIWYGGFILTGIVGLLIGQLWGGLIFAGLFTLAVGPFFVAAGAAMIRESKKRRN